VVASVPIVMRVLSSMLNFSISRRTTNAVIIFVRLAHSLLSLSSFPNKRVFVF
jgi:hypothetical protein